MTSDPNQPRVPRPVPGCDLRSLPLTPSQAFVLSRIDGTLSTQDLSSMTGLPDEEIDRTLDRLAELGAVTWEGMAERPPVSQASRHQSEVVSRAREGMQRPVVETYSQPPPSESGQSMALYDPAELDEECDVPPDKRRRILDAFYQLDDLTYYELLGVATDATKKEIKDAYYRLAAEYHPDRYFRKNLGSFKQKMELVFARVTTACDTLTRKQTRDEYDAYLDTRQSTRRIERVLHDDAPAREEAPRAEPSGPASKRERDGSGARTSSERIRAAAWAAPPPPKGMTNPDAGRPPQPAVRRSSAAIKTKESVRARREAFAARISGGRVSRMPPARASQPAEVSSSLPPEQAGEALRRHVQERKEAVRRAQVKKYADTAQEALERGDAAAAANAYRLALQVMPDDPALQQAHEDAQQKATTMLSGSYLEQARYEERAERWKQAARSYSRAAEGMPDDALVQAKTAETMLRGNLDLRKASEYAKRATGLDPKNPSFHVILGKIYLAAGLALNARREFELAAELAPSDATIARLLESVRKGARS